MNTVQRGLIVLIVLVLVAMAIRNLPGKPATQGHLAYGI